MKILHFADLHLGIESYGRLNPETGLSTRLEDFLSALDRVIEYALSESVDLVLFCGDAYQRKDPTQTYQREFARRLIKLSRAGIATLLVPGNHDLHPAIRKATSVEIFQALSIPNIYTPRRPQLYHIATRNGEIQVLAIPWLWRSALLTGDEFKMSTHDAISQEMSRIIEEVIRQESSNISQVRPAILAAHLWVTGSRVGTEQRYLPETDYSLLSSALAMPAFDYVALGHIHRQQAFPGDPPIAYAGSLERIDFSDEDIPKGFYLVEIDHHKPRPNREARYSFIELPARKFLTIAIKLEQEEANPLAVLMQEIARQGEKIKGSIVRLEVHWPHANRPNLHEPEIRKALKEAFLVAGINWITPKQSRLRLHIPSTSSLSPMEALKEYLKIKKVSPTEAEELQSYTEKLIKELSSSES